MATRVTLASIDTKLEGFMEVVKQHMQDDHELFKTISDTLNGNGKAGIKTRLELVESQLTTAKDNNKLGWKTITTIIASIVAGVILKVWIG